MLILDRLQPTDAHPTYCATDLSLKVYTTTIGTPLRNPKYLMLHRIAFYQLLHLIEGTESGMPYFYNKAPKKNN